MANEWNNLSETFANRQKNIASIKLKKRTPIYKHVVLRKFSKDPEDQEKSEIEVKNEFLLLPKVEEGTRSNSFCVPRLLDNTRMRFTEASPFTSRESYLAVNLLKGKTDLPMFIMNCRINLGKKILTSPKTAVLSEFSSELLEKSKEEVDFHYFYNDSDKGFNVICFGKSAPTSQCCNVQLVIQFSRECGGKITCPHRNCLLKCLRNFMISKKVREVLWEDFVKKDPQKKVKSLFPDFGKSQSPENDIFFKNSTIIAAPKDLYSTYMDPLQKLLKSRKKLGFPY